MSEIRNRIEKQLRKFNGRVSYSTIVAEDGSEKLSVSVVRRVVMTWDHPLAKSCLDYNALGDKIEAALKAPPPQIIYTPKEQARMFGPRQTGKTAKNAAKRSAREARKAAERAAASVASKKPPKDKK